MITGFHTKNNSIVGFDPATGDAQVPWLESSIYDAWQSSGVPKWTDFVKDLPAFDTQSKSKTPAAALTKAGLVGLDGRYLNNAPQCTGWMDLTGDGGSGSFYILWSGLYKLTTAAAIPYYTGQYAPSESNGHSIANLRSMFEFVAKKKGLDFILETRGKIPACLYGDDVRLRQILTNLCSNAVKFTSDGYIKLTVTAVGDSMVFDIKDTGMGIREEDIEKLFMPFVQADMRKNRNVTGTGLGLTISKNIAEMMGGGIKVSSVYGKGTTFTVTLPKILGDESKVADSFKKKNERSFYAPAASVLVVDDNEVNLKVARGLLNLFKMVIVAKIIDNN